MSASNVEEWASLRPAFASQINQIAKESDIAIVWHSANWIAELRQDAKVAYVIGYTFPLNNAASARLANDKVATYTLLAAKGVPAVPHHLLRFPAGMSLDAAVGAAQAMVRLPMVAKPHEESSGIGVYRARSSEELRQVIVQLAVKYSAITLSPWTPIKEEFRVVMLDGRPRITYRKVRSPGRAEDKATEWRHNLRYGAVPELLSDGQVCRDVGVLAFQAMATLDLRFASVDIVLVADSLVVLELNSAVTLEHFSRHCEGYAELAKGVYKEAVLLSLSQ